MITLFVIGILVFAFKLVHFALKTTWGIAKGILFGIGIPAVLIVLFSVGLATLAVPLLLVGLLTVFILPARKGI